jgi:hypothetical protein
MTVMAESAWGFQGKSNEAWIPVQGRNDVTECLKASISVKSFCWVLRLLCLDVAAKA